MRLGSNQPYFFPYIGYFQLIKSVDVFLLYSDIKFVKESWVSRNRLLNKSTHDPFYIRVPIGNRNSAQLIRDVKLRWNKPVWTRKFKNSLESNYASAKFFDETFEFLSALLATIHTDHLHVLNAETIKAVCAHLNIGTQMIDESPIFASVEDAVRQEPQALDLSLPRHVRRVLMLCEKFKAQTYYNLPGGKALYNTEDFADRGITIKFLSDPQTTYAQFKAPFVPQLSILDVLMHNGKSRTMDMLGAQV